MSDVLVVTVNQTIIVIFLESDEHKIELSVVFFYNLLVVGESSRKRKNLERHKVRRRDKGMLKS